MLKLLDTCSQIKIGLILTMRDDFDFMETCLSSLKTTEESFGLVVIDSSKGNEVVEYCKKEEICCLKQEDFIHLTRALNAGIEYFLDKPEIRFIGWVHGDMQFPQRNWLGELRRYLEKHKDVGRVASRNVRDKGMPNFALEEPGNELPCLWTKEALEKILKADGYIFDVNFLGIGGREDWDLLWRILLNYRCMITPTSKVFHLGMGTRSRRFTVPEQLYNAAYYNAKWETDQPPV